MLGKPFEDGTNLSGGEWQKFALVPAYLRDAGILILDEPTAALDTLAEFEVFNRFAELLISHRLSTFPSIVVLKHAPSTLLSTIIVTYEYIVLTLIHRYS